LESSWQAVVVKTGKRGQAIVKAGGNCIRLRIRDLGLLENLPGYPSGGELGLKSLGNNSRLTQWGGE
jgi:hypothetical protein